MNCPGVIITANWFRSIVKLFFWKTTIINVQYLWSSQKWVLFLQGVNSQTLRSLWHLCYLLLGWELSIVFNTGSGGLMPNYRLSLLQQVRHHTRTLCGILTFRIYSHWLLLWRTVQVISGLKLLRKLSFLFFELEKSSNSTNYTRKNQNHKKTSVRFELITYLSSASHHNHYTR